MRLFVAVVPDEKVRRELLLLGQNWRRMGVRGNYSTDSQLHITLAFLGERNDPRQVLEALREVDFPAFEVRFSRTGAFPSLWWAGTDRCPGLERLAAAVRAKLDQKGVEYDRKRFMPHVTLVRRPALPDTDTDGTQIRTCVRPDASCRVSRFSLMKSERGERGMVYTEIGSVCARD
ncbi:MAG: RNA 2',3'-cyclic phosphodiesterase [Clostridia bacterium]|nr:RNA 2',3'-cyclic phosphodiesterase [Clostridia bacterium]